jgi:hypothetical protein
MLFRKPIIPAWRQMSFTAVIKRLSIASPPQESPYGLPPFFRPGGMDIHWRCSNAVSIASTAGQLIMLMFMVEGIMGDKYEPLGRERFKIEYANGGSK